MPGSTFRILTLGCRLNQSESDEVARALTAADLVPCGADACADVTIVNTCTVTGDASKSSRKLIRRAVAAGERVVVTGCHAVAAPAECAVPGVVAVVPNEDKEALARTVLGLGGIEACAGTARSAAAGEAMFAVRGSFGVQTGCDAACTFCIIPTTRGAPVSRPEAGVVAGIRGQVQMGVREVALTGVHLGRYGVDRGDSGALSRLVRRVLDGVPELAWLRLSSIEADCVSQELLDVMAAEPRVCPHLHVPLQAGDDMTLRAMGRPYDTAGYAEVLRRARDTLGPDAGLTADVMVGFPGETDASFRRGLEFVAGSELTGLHVFRYSPRPGTKAASLRDQVDESVKKERSARMRSAGAALTAAFGSRFVGRSLPVMIERASAGTSTGTSDNYLKVTTHGPAAAVGSVVDVRVAHADASGVSGPTTWA